ncbi:preprotein translocase subunit SecA [Candidatus Nardonella dryophthoridicola]|uniref:preprotein translocase subunit SecA n=1 Tax=Candidatus Nardonella dryophthoridicola TaxID=1971485 RepID=UPI001AD85A38|nr:preprotein translocase subunit SecA [Candidatus Nardonella dryophthoridicola]QTJ62930.1 preprotein translocase subunit SecA [Candidatus Nardonella dryophthoridicola]
MFFINKIINILNLNNYNNNYYLKNKFNNILNSINLYDKKIINFDNKELKNKTIEFKKRIRSGENLDTIIVEAFSVVKEAVRRIYGIKYYDVQILGGLALNYGCVIEMSTGEGKTLTSVLPAYLNSLTGDGVHIVTINEYLAKRDFNSNKKIFNFLGLSVGLNISNINTFEKIKEYNNDIVYGTNNEFCFDYLKDNLVLNIKNKVQNKLNYVIIDEIDSILIDESITPLIISGKSIDDSTIYKNINKFIYLFDINNTLNNKFYKIDFLNKNIYYTSLGYNLIEDIIFNLKLINNKKKLYYKNNIIFIKYVTSLIKSYLFFKKNIDYIIKNNKIILIDQNTGRLCKNKRISDGIHQAIEAKENVKILEENINIASITFQNYFKLYKKISGMTGTAYTEKEEFKYIYGLNTIKIPSNKPLIRKDLNDIFFINEESKIKYIINDIKKCIKKNRPVLIGTISIEKSELISLYLKKNNIPHNLLNAKNYEIEAKIISKVGKPGNVTIATNIAGRGTDIILGGDYNLFNRNIWIKNNNIVKKSGGLYIIGTERFDSRRIDNQLIGRSGRQGDPGSSRFYLSLEDKLFSKIINNNIKNIINNIKDNKKFFIKNKFISKMIYNIQKSIEKKNFQLRKQILIYDNIFDIQRNIIYKIRNYILCNCIYNMYKKFKLFFILKILKKYINKKSYNIDKLLIFIKKKFNINIKRKYKYVLYKNNIFSIKYIIFIINKKFNKFEKKINYRTLIIIIRNNLLKILDLIWINHINNINNLQQNIYLKIYANKDPYQEYILNSFLLFNKMINKWKYKSIFKIFNIIKNI